jgi:ethanolamine utilization protein EutK
MAANAYGFLEVRGLVTAVEAADAMVKSAPVRMAGQVTTNPALITLIVEGDIGACAAAIDAGRLAAARLGEIVSSRLIGRPEPDIDLFVPPALRAPVAAVPALPSPPAVKAASPRHQRKKHS